MIPIPTRPALIAAKVVNPQQGRNYAYVRSVQEPCLLRGPQIRAQTEPQANAIQSLYMALNPNQLGKPLSKVRKLLKKMRKQPPPEQVHDLRTNTRRVEASLKALQLDTRRKGRRVLKTLTPLRKRAGRVRDLDVLTGFASGLPRNGNQDAIVQLLEHLGQSRHQAARKLYKSLRKRRRTAATRLKGCALLIERNLNGRGKRQKDEWSANATADALQLSAQLASWPRLTPQNLHPFRLKVKELRNVLKMAGDEREFGKKLGDVKDAIGEWHDWTVLSSITRKTLGKSQGKSLVQRIDDVAKQKEESALKLSNQLRSQYFKEGSTNERNPRSKGIPEPVLKSVAELAV